MTSCVGKHLDPQDLIALISLRALGLTQQQIARVIHVHQSTISRWLKFLKLEFLSGEYGSWYIFSKSLAEQLKSNPMYLDSLLAQARARLVGSTQ